MKTLFECRARKPRENITQLNTLLIIIDKEKEREKGEKRERHREKKTFRELHHHILFRQ